MGRLKSDYVIELPAKFKYRDYMKNTISMFCCKSMHLFKHFLNVYSTPPFTLSEVGKDRSMIHYINTKKGKPLSKDIRGAFENKAFLANFSSYDAAYIGYLYGIWIQSEQEQN